LRPEAKYQSTHPKDDRPERHTAKNQHEEQAIQCEQNKRAGESKSEQHWHCGASNKARGEQA
jgi:hypothetical protein